MSYDEFGGGQQSKSRPRKKLKTGSSEKNDSGDAEKNKVWVSQAKAEARNPVQSVRLRSNENATHFRHIMMTVKASDMKPNATTFADEEFLDNPQAQATKSCLAFVMQFASLLRYQQIAMGGDERTMCFMEVVYEDITGKSENSLIAADLNHGMPAVSDGEEDDVDDGSGQKRSTAERQAALAQQKRYEKAMREEVGRAVAARRIHVFWTERAYEARRAQEAKRRDPDEAVPPRAASGSGSASSSQDHSDLDEAEELASGGSFSNSRAQAVMDEIATFVDNKRLVDEKDLEEEADEFGQDEDDPVAKRRREREKRERTQKRLAAAEAEARKRFPMITNRFKCIRDLMCAFVLYNKFVAHKDASAQLPITLAGRRVDDHKNGYSPRWVFAPAYSVRMIRTAPKSQRTYDNYRGAKFLTFPVPDCVYLLTAQEMCEYACTRFPDLPAPADLGPQHKQHMDFWRDSDPVLRQHRMLVHSRLLDERKHREQAAEEEKKRVTDENPFGFDESNDEDPSVVEDCDNAEALRERLRLMEIFRERETRVFLKYNKVPNTQRADYTFDSVAEENAADLLKVSQQIENKNKEPGVTEQQKREFEQEAMLKYRQAALSKFRVLWEGTGQMSETSRIILNHLKKELEDEKNTNKNFFHLRMIKPYTDLSTTGDLLVFLASYWKTVYGCTRNFTSALRMFLAFMHQFGKNKLNPNQLLVGDHQAGKSFIMNIMISCFIKGVIVDLQSMSACAQNVSGDTSDRGFVMQEFNPEIFGVGRGNKDTTSQLEANWKNKLTSNEIYALVFRFNPVTGEREAIEVYNKCNNTYAFACNAEGSSQFRKAMLSRFHVVEFQYDKCTADSDVSAGQAESSRASSFPPYAETLRRVWQLAIGLVWLIQKLLWTGVFQPINMRYAESLIGKILNEAGRNGAINVHEERPRARIMAYLRVIVILSAVFQHFIYNPHARADRRFELIHIFDIEPYLYPTAEQICLAVELGANQYENTLSLHVMEAIKTMYFPAAGQKKQKPKAAAAAAADQKAQQDQKEAEKTAETEYAFERPVRNSRSECIREYEERKAALAHNPDELVKFVSSSNIKCRPTRDGKGFSYHYTDPDRLAVRIDEGVDVADAIAKALRSSRGYTEEKTKQAFNQLQSTRVARMQELTVYNDHTQFTVPAVAFEGDFLIVSKKSLLNGAHAPIQTAIKKVMSYSHAPPDRVWVRPLTVHPASSSWEAYVIQPDPANKMVIESDPGASEEDDYRIRCAANMVQSDEFDSGRHLYDAQRVFRRFGRQTITEDIDHLSMTERMSKLGLRVATGEAKRPSEAAASSSSSASAAAPPPPQMERSQSILTLLPVSSRLVTPEMERNYWEAERERKGLRRYKPVVDSERRRFYGDDAKNQAPPAMGYEALHSSDPMDDEEKSELYGVPYRPAPVKAPANKKGKKKAGAASPKKPKATKKKQPEAGSSAAAAGSLFDVKGMPPLRRRFPASGPAWVPRQPPAASSAASSSAAAGYTDEDIREAEAQFQEEERQQMQQRTGVVTRGTKRRAAAAADDD